MTSLYFYFIYFFYLIFLRFLLLTLYSVTIKKVIKNCVAWIRSQAEALRRENQINMRSFFTVVTDKLYVKLLWLLTCGKLFCHLLACILFSVLMKSSSVFEQSVSFLTISRWLFKEKYYPWGLFCDNSLHISNFYDSMKPQSTRGYFSYPLKLL